MLAHVAGLPVEELLVSMTSAGGGIVLAARLLVVRLRRRDADAQASEKV